MPQPRQGARILGPYERSDRRGQYYCFAIDDQGRKAIEPLAAQNAQAAQDEVEALRARLVPVLSLPREITVEAAITDYETYLREVKGNKAASIATTLFRLRRFFWRGDLELKRITAAWCEKRYIELCQGQAVDTHRNTLAEARTWLRWCAAKPRGWLRGMPLAEVKGQGRRRHGKPQLRIDEARAWRDTAYKLAEGGDEGALAALLALELGLRAGEIVTRVARDVDDGGAVLWIDDAEGWTPKSDKSRRARPVPPRLAVLLRDQKKTRLPLTPLFRAPRAADGRHDTAWIRAQVKRICGLAQVPEVCAHAQRGLRATLDTLAGMDLRAVADVLGHADSGRTAERSYVAPEAREQQRDERVMKVLAGGKG